MDILIEKWDEILEKVKEDNHLSNISFKTWLKPLIVHKMEGNVVTIIVPSEQVGLDYISNKYRLFLQVAIAEVLDLDDCELRLILPADADPVVSRNTDKSQDLRCEEAHLNPRYTFDTFVVGNNNKLAQAAALAVSESPGEVYNPLFIYGGAGLGKTHLMHSIAHFIIEHNVNSKVLYVTSGEFTNEVIQSIRNGNNTAMARLREKYRNIDVLLVDDIQFIIGKDSTQEEFFHTFNSLHSAKKAIIISSDKPPKDMDVLEERFRSRFEWGLIADITPPDYETRMAILHKKEESDGFHIDESIIKYIAENINSNIRELEGALNKVVAHARINNKAELTLDFAKDVLKDIISPDEKKPVTPEYILSTVGDHFGLTIEDLCSKKKSAKYMQPRQICMYLCREMLMNANLSDIGNYIGGRDHSTIIHGINKIEQLMETDEELRQTIQLLKTKIAPASTAS